MMASARANGNWTARESTTIKKAVHYRFDENLIGQDLLEIIQSDKLDRRPETVPIEQTVINGTEQWDK